MSMETGDMIHQDILVFFQGDSSLTKLSFSLLASFHFKTVVLYFVLFYFVMYTGIQH